MASERPAVGELRKGRDILPADDSTEGVIGDAEIKSAFGEDLAQTLNIETWSDAIDWEGAVDRIKVEIDSAVQREDRLKTTIRNELLPRISTRPNAPPEAGVYKTTPAELESVHIGLLFPGRVEAVDGTSITYDSLPLDIVQLGVAIVSYGGVSATFSQRIFRKEIASSSDPYQAALEIIQMRDGRQGVGQKDGLSELGRRGVMTFAERKVLVDKAKAEWRIGHGDPCPYELLTGSGSMFLLDGALELLRRLIMEQRRFVFVPSAPNERGLLTLGSALRAGEYAVIDTTERRMLPIVEKGHYARGYKRKAEEFVRECGPRVLFGLFRASEASPPYMFYAPRDEVHLAARIAIADSILQPERGFPMLLGVADTACTSAFGGSGFLGIVHDAYAKVGAPYRFSGERETRG